MKIQFIKAVSIKNYIRLFRMQFLNKVNEVRFKTSLNYWQGQPLNNNLTNYLYERHGDNISNLVLSDALGDGYCFYNALSLSLFGNQTNSTILRLADTFIFLEYENFIRRFIENISFERLVEMTATDKAWQREIHITALSILCNRPVYSFDSNCTYPIFSCATNTNHDHIIIFFSGNHYSCILPHDQSFPYTYYNGHSRFQDLTDR
jgi:hypothetical protein